MMNELGKKSWIWNKGYIIPGYDPNQYRWDDFGSVIKYEEHGLNSRYGWHSDHIIPKALGGSDHIFNLRPLHWYTNTSQGGILSRILQRKNKIRGRGGILSGILAK